MSDEPRHLLFLPRGHRYELVEREGSPPEVGSEIEVEGRFVVTKVGPSPLPADDRRCAYLMSAE